MLRLRADVGATEPARKGWANPSAGEEWPAAGCQSAEGRPWYAKSITISPLASRLGLIFFNKELRG